MLNKLTLSICCFAILVAGSSFVSAQKPLAIKGAKIITMTGEPIENGTIIFRDGRIVDVGADLKVPVEAKVIDATGKIVMPGIVEAHSSSGMSQANESNPLVPYVSVLDSIDPMNSYFKEARRNGVTSVAITPGNSTMIGGQAAVIKTSGEFLDEMILKPDAGVKISLRPIRGSRMSHLSRLRKALKDAKKKLDKKDGKKDDKKKDDDKKVAKKDGKADSKKETAKKDDKKSTPARPESELDKAMFKLLEGELPAIIYCDKAMDVGQALRLIEEFKLEAKLVLGRECHKAAEQVAKSGLPVILDSTLVFWEEDPRTKEETKIILPQLFGEYNVKFVCQVRRSAAATLGNNYLWYQAATCVKYGMEEQEALESLTTLPSKFLGVDKLVGSIEKGKDGDVVILSGDPLKIDTWVEKTLVNGVVVYDREEDKQLMRLLGLIDEDGKKVTLKTESVKADAKKADEKKTERRRAGRTGRRRGSRSRPEANKSDEKKADAKKDKKDK